MLIDQPPAPPPASDTAVSEVVVRAARLPPSAADAAFSIDVIAPEALKENPRLDEALETSPGASLYRRTSSIGANPTTQGISLRGIAGSGASRALVTLDGVPQNDPFGGWVIWSALPSEGIGGATLVRGAGAGPYGAGALTGTVSLQTLDAAPGSYSADLSYGSYDDWRGVGVGTTKVGPTVLTAVVGGESSDGYIGVRPPRRGAADIPLSLSSETGALTATTDIGDVASTVRVAGYKEKRSAGLVGAASTASGLQASATLAAQPTPEKLGWRLQAWTIASDLANSSVSTALDRSSTTPANNQYATPALGWGVNAAVRTGSIDRSLEVGVDLRGTDGEDREQFRVISGAFTRNRLTGGSELVGGLYAEAQQKTGRWLFAEGLRADGWTTYRAHRTERDTATGATTLDTRTKDRSGVVPTGRLGIRRDLEGDLGAYVRTAVYAGFRPPTLNELHRPFRVGNDITEANPGLRPERLYGAEVGGGLGSDRLGASGDLFFNRLDDAIANVTRGLGPFTDPIAGVVPAGGSLRQRMNAGRVDAYGLEAEGHYRPLAHVELTAEAAYTHAEVDGEDIAPQLTGLRPALTPRLTMTAAARWQALEKLRLSAALRYESVRFDDDQNVRKLAPATTLDLRGEYALTSRMSIAVAVDNANDACVQNARSADGTITYSAPRTARVELRIKG